MYLVRTVIALSIYVLLPVIQAIENAREVEGGVELLQLGPIELIIPEVLSFTLKCQGKFEGDFYICYAAETIMMNEKDTFDNLGAHCPTNFCFLSVHSSTRANALSQKIRGDTIYNEFHDTDYLQWCPRKVINNRQNFTVIKLPPHCPVIVNDARLPNDQVSKSKSNLKWIIIVCALIILLYGW
uniref:ZP domain-containing protein n=1 Tax=Panagrellus redivivus TaxID=6233 RepID=A0A7E4VR10_PANRE